MREDVRRELLRAAASCRTVTYGFLMKKFGLSRGRGIVRAIGEFDGDEAKKGAPGFASIVVRKDTGYPGGGFFCWEGLPAGLRRPKERGLDPRLSERERAYVRTLQREVWSFYSKRTPSRPSTRRS